MPWFEIWVQPYSDRLARVLALGPIGEPEISNRWPGGIGAASEGWITNSASGRELAWPPCTHAETCNPENDADNL